MTLTAADIARYEERAANGEKPKLPWQHKRGSWGYTPDTEYLVGLVSVVEHPSRKGDPYVAWYLTGKPDPMGFNQWENKRQPFATLAAAQLFLEDRLLAFAAPLMDSEAAIAAHVDRVFAKMNEVIDATPPGESQRALANAIQQVMGDLTPVLELGYEVGGKAALALVQARLQSPEPPDMGGLAKEQWPEVCGLVEAMDAPVEGPWEMWQGEMSGTWKVGYGGPLDHNAIKCSDQAEADDVRDALNRAWQRRQKEKGDE